MRENFQFDHWQVLSLWKWNLLWLIRPSWTWSWWGVPAGVSWCRTASSWPCGTGVRSWPRGSAAPYSPGSSPGSDLAPWLAGGQPKNSNSMVSQCSVGHWTSRSDKWTDSSLLLLNLYIIIFNMFHRFNNSKVIQDGQDLTNDNTDILNLNF